MNCSRRGFIKRISVLGVALFMSNLFFGIESLAETPKLPNVVLIFTDDQGWGDIGCFGLMKGKTPHLDRMASEGMKFTDFYVNCGQCSGSRAALMTGCHYQRISMPTVSWPNESGGLHPSETTIAELLQAEGYATACIGKWHLGHRPGFLPIDQGFDYYYGIPYSNDMTYDTEMVRSENIVLREGWTNEKLDAYKKAKENKNKVPLMRNREVIEFPVDQKTLTKRYTEEATKFIREHKDEPFFVYLPHSMPHNPIAVSKAFEPDLTNSKNELQDLYAKVMEEIDWSVGEILKTLKELGLDENTLVIFTSDNGPNTGSTGGLRGSKATVYEGGMRVPCIMRWPESIPAGGNCSEVATTLDILPTLAGIVGGKIPTDRVIDGKDILPLMIGKPDAKTPHSAYAYIYKEGGVRSGKWKYYPFRSGKGKKEKFNADDLRAKSPVQLYDLSADLSEEKNLAEQYPQVVQRLQKAYDDLKKDIAANKRPSGHFDAKRQAPYKDKEWVSLFDGKTLNGWIQKNGKATYRVSNGVIVGRTALNSPNSFLCTEGEYGDFELEFEVNLINSELNSGVQIRSKTQPAKGNEKFGRVNGPQVEIEAAGSKGAESGYIYGEACGGWMTPNEKLKPLKVFKDGQWNKYRIVARGPRLMTWINGKPVEDLVDEEKFKTHPKGFIGLQVHGVGDRGPFEVAWRNIWIKVTDKK